MGIAIFGQGFGEGRGDRQPVVSAQGLDQSERADDRRCCPGEERSASRSVRRNEPPAVPGRVVSHRRQLLEFTHASGQSVCGLVVVPQGIHAAERLCWQNRMAELPRHQLSWKYLAEREADRELGAGRGRVAHVRVQRHLRREAGSECGCGADLGPHGREPRHHLCRLEPGAARQEHGAVARRVLEGERAGCIAVSGSDVQGRFPGEQCRPSDGNRTSKERH